MGIKKRVVLAGAALAVTAAVSGCDLKYVSRANIGSNGYGGQVNFKAVGDGETGYDAAQTVVLCRRPNGSSYYRTAPYYSGPGTGYGGTGNGNYTSVAWCDQTTDRAVSISYNVANVTAP